MFSFYICLNTHYRGKAIDERKTKLLKDYKSNQKSNIFVDKRFGENDPSLSLEEKMFARFQKDRARKARHSSSVFALSEGDGEFQLTHKGKILGESNLDDRDDFSENDRDDEIAGSGKLMKDVVDNLHFGGGFVKKDSSGDDFRKDRLTALQEIVMKSKMAKIERKEFKEHQEDEREKLDKAFDSLLTSSTLDVTNLEKTKHGRYKRDKSIDASVDEGAFGDSYDQALMEMAFETKAKPTDRTKSAEEIALEAKEKLEKLELARLKRMRGEPVSDDDEAGVDRDSGPARKSTAKAIAKAKENNMPRRRTDDDLEDFDLSSSGKLERREGSHADLRGNDPSDDGSEADNDSEEEIVDDEEDEDEDEDDEEEGDEDDNMDDEDDFEDDVLDPNALVESSVDRGQVMTPAAVPQRKKATIEERRGEATRNSLPPPSKVNEKMPHKIDCPADLGAFDELLDSYVGSSLDFRALVDRILIWNSVRLPGQQGAENKAKMHNFMDILLKVFVREADKLAVVKEEEDVLDVKSQVYIYRCYLP